MRLPWSRSRAYALGHQRGLDLGFRCAMHRWPEGERPDRLIPHFCPGREFCEYCAETRVAQQLDALER